MTCSVPPHMAGLMKLKIPIIVDYYYIEICTIKDRNNDFSLREIPKLFFPVAPMGFRVRPQQSVRKLTRML